jgi:O-antigen/teichoic acid export membrane protein
MQVSVLALSIERKTGLIAACSWLAVLVSAAANSVLIPRLGVLGASLANLATYLVLSGTSLFFSQRLHPLPLETGKLGVLLAVGAIVLLASLRLDRFVDGATGVGVKLAILAGILAFGMLARIVTWPMIRDALPASRAGA